jgi:hypothetical protein
MVARRDYPFDNFFSHLSFDKVKSEIMFDQVLANVTDTEPLARNAVIRTMAEQHANVQISDISESHEPLCTHHASGLHITRDQSMHLASQLRALCDQAVGMDAALAYAAGVGNGVRESVGESLRDASLRGLREMSMSIRNRTPARDGSVSGRGQAVQGSPIVVDCSAHGPRVLDRALDKASGGLIEVLDQGSGVELWCENRFGPVFSLSRLLKSKNIFQVYCFD